MPKTLSLEDVLRSNEVVSRIERAWRDSLPGTADAHEEGGFIVVDDQGNFSVARWQVGKINEIVLPLHKDCVFERKEIVGSFHTHPNTGRRFQREPSLTDIRAVRDDPDLKGERYVGEFVISKANIYLIEPSGKVTIVGETEQIFARAK